MGIKHHLAYIQLKNNEYQVFKLFCKGTNDKYFVLCGPNSLSKLFNYHCSANIAIDNKQMKEVVML